MERCGGLIRPRSPPRETPLPSVRESGMQYRMQSGWQRPLFTLLFLGAAAFAADDKKLSRGERQSGESHMKEELGVNQFTTPGIDVVLQALRDLRPVPYDSVSRDMPEATPRDRAQLALVTGGIIADGFLAVVAEKQSRIEPIGRALLRHAKALGVGDYVTAHTRSILEQAATKQWDGVRAELIGAQRDVEKGMMALRDEEVAHLVSLGGWWRGLEITSELIARDYSPEKAALLVQGNVLDYFADRVSTLNPRLRERPLFVLLEANLKEVRKLSVKEERKAPSLDEVKKIRDLAKATNQAVVKISE